MKASLPTKPMYCSREYFKTSRLIQQYEKPTSNPLFTFLYEKEPPFGNSSQPCQNLGGLQAATYCFAVLFENISGRVRKILEQEKIRKEASHSML